MREARNLTQGQLELKAGVSQSEISHLELGKRDNSKLSTVSRLARALGVPASDLLIDPTVVVLGEKMSPNVLEVVARLQALPPDVRDRAADAIVTMLLVSIEPRLETQLRKVAEEKEPYGPHGA